MRVQIPPYTDAWMQGDRYGEVLSTKAGGYITAGETVINGTFGIKDAKGNLVTIARVKLDKSGRTKAFILDDCTVV